jgi:hypothetical protein
MKNRKHEFWVSNISRLKDIALGDLRLTIRRGESRNLLDPRHYSYTLEQLQKSAAEGSIKLKSQFIKVRDVPPPPQIAHGIYVKKEGRLIKPPRNHIDVVVPKFDELDFDVKAAEEKFAAEEADMEMSDHQPALPVDKQYLQPLQPVENQSIPNLNLDEEDWGEE